MRPAFAVCGLVALVTSSADALHGFAAGGRWSEEQRATLRSLIDYGTAEALTTFGRIGVKAWIYRGDMIPEFYGNAFVAEPAANFVRRSVLALGDGTVRGRNAYEQKEFVSSTDERFRPVSFATGPDGALYYVAVFTGEIRRLRYGDPAPPPPPPTGTEYLSDLPWTSATNGWGPVERDRSNGETGPRPERN